MARTPSPLYESCSLSRSALPFCVPTKPDKTGTQLPACTATDAHLPCQRLPAIRFSSVDDRNITDLTFCEDEEEKNKWKGRKKWSFCILICSLDNLGLEIASECARGRRAHLRTSAHSTRALTQQMKIKSSTGRCAPSCHIPHYSDK